MGASSLGSPQSLNLYAYVQNNPIDLIDPSGLCVFRVTIVIPRGMNVGTYGTQEVLDAAKAEITRIFEEAGHKVIFGKGKADAAYTTSLLPGTSADNPSRIAYTNPGTNSGGVMTGKLTEMANSPGGADGVTVAGQGIGLGRVIAHEKVAHFLLASLGTNTSEHTSTGLTRRSFDAGTLFKSDKSNLYNLDPTQAQQLNEYCKKTPPPNNVAGGGGIDSNYYGGRGGYPSWWYSMQEFVNWVNSIPVGERDGWGEPKILD
jgi:hypothetical protein